MAIPNKNTNGYNKAWSLVKFGYILLELCVDNLGQDALAQVIFNLNVLSFLVK